MERIHVASPEQLEKLLTFLDKMSPPRSEPGFALRPGFALYRPNGACLGHTRPGDRLVHGTSAAGGPSGVHLPMPTSHTPEWLQGQLNDEQGPVYGAVLVLAGAVDPHAV